MNNLIDELETLIKEKRPELHNALEAGVSNEKLKKILGNNYKSTPNTLLVIWAWHNGQNQTYSGDFHPSTNEMLMSVQHSLDTMQFLNEYLESGEIPPNNWNTNWLPFTENGGGNYMCVSLASGEVYYYDKYASSTGIRYQSVDKWLDNVIDGYKCL